MDRDYLVQIKLSPYLPGRGPTYGLETWDTGRVDDRGQTIIGYSFGPLDPSPHTLFEGEDFAGSPMHADDSAETVAALLGFLTLRPGDTDSDYFADYSAEQLEFCDTDAETLQSYAYCSCLLREENPDIWDPPDEETCELPECKERRETV